MDNAFDAIIFDLISSETWKCSSEALRANDPPRYKLNTPSTNWPRHTLFSFYFHIRIRIFSSIARYILHIFPSTPRFQENNVQPENCLRTRHRAVIHETSHNYIVRERNYIPELFHTATSKSAFLRQKNVVTVPLRDFFPIFWIGKRREENSALCVSANMMLNPIFSPTWIMPRRVFQWMRMGFRRG